MKYSDLHRAIFSIFDIINWRKSGVPTYPSNVQVDASVTRYIRVHIIPSGPGLNPTSASGVLMIDIFVPAGRGPMDVAEIADKLDSFLLPRVIQLTDEPHTTQFLASGLRPIGVDSANPTLYRASYTVQFNHYGGL